MKISIKIQRAIAIILYIILCTYLIGQIKITWNVSITSSISFGDKKFEIPTERTYTSKICKIFSIRKSEIEKAEDLKEDLSKGLFKFAVIDYEVSDINFVKFGEEKE